MQANITNWCLVCIYKSKLFFPKTESRTTLLTRPLKLCKKYGAPGNFE